MRDDAHPTENDFAMDDYYLSLIIPVYNAQTFIAQSVENVLRYFAAQSYRAEIILVDDASTDGTLGVLREYEGRVRVLSNDRNMGKGYSVRRGVLSAGGRFIFFTDADIPFGLEPIPTFLKYLDQKEFDLVIGSRDLAESIALMKPTAARRLSSRIFTIFVSRLVVTGVSDTQCGFKGFRRDAAVFLFSRSRIDRFAFDIEVIYIAFKNNFDVKRLPVHLRRCDSSTVRLISDGFRMLTDIFLIKWNHSRGFYQ